MPPPGLQIYFWPHVTLDAHVTFDLLICKVDHFMPLLRGLLVPISI